MHKKDASILFVTLSLERGGTEQHLAEIAPRLSERGWRVGVYCLLRGGALAANLTAKGVTVIEPPVTSRGGLLGLTSLIQIVTAGSKLAWVMARQRPEIVHFFLPAPYIIGGPISLLTRRPVRIMSRRNQNRYHTRRVFARLVERWLHQRMTAILGNSRRIVDELITDEGCDPERVGLIYNGVDIARFSDNRDRAERRKALRLEEFQTVLVIVSNLIAYKGHADLFRALGRVKSKLPGPWLLLCAGRDDGYRAVLEDVAFRQGIEEHVIFLGSRPDIPLLLGASDIGLLCSHEEGFANAILEGMAAGLPMIVTNVGGNAEAVQDGVTGLVVPSLDPDSLGEAILKLANDRVLAAQMGRAARERAQRKFSILTCVDNYERVYDGLLQGRQISTLAPAGPDPDPVGADVA